jgi:hypothetical protein
LRLQAPILRSRNVGQHSIARSLSIGHRLQSPR